MQTWWWAFWFNGFNRHTYNVEMFFVRKVKTNYYNNSIALRMTWITKDHVTHLLCQYIPGGTSVTPPVTQEPRSMVIAKMTKMLGGKLGCGERMERIKLWRCCGKWKQQDCCWVMDRLDWWRKQLHRKLVLGNGKKLVAASFRNEAKLHVVCE